MELIGLLESANKKTPIKIVAIAKQILIISCVAIFDSILALRPSHIIAKLLESLNFSGL